MKVTSGSHIYCPHSVAGSCCGQTIAPCMPTIMGKQQAKAMKAHTLRHFSIAGLMRDQNFQAACVQLEDIVVKKHRRRVDLLPQGVLTLHAVVEVLIDFSADHHKRKNGFSQFHSDKTAWCAHNNGDLLAESWDHWCKSAITDSPCCNSQDDCRQQNVRLTNNACL